MGLIKAGIYRFNDELTQGEFFGDISIPFTTYANLSAFVGTGYENVLLVCSTMYQEHLDDDIGSLQYIFVNSTPVLPTSYPFGQYVWDTNYGWSKFSDMLQTITITEDTEVSAEFAEWFADNTEEQRLIKSGFYRFNKDLTRPTFKTDYETNTLLANIKHTGKVDIDGISYEVVADSLLYNGYALGSNVIKETPSFSDNLPTQSYNYDFRTLAWVPFLNDPSKRTAYFENAYVSVDVANWLAENTMHGNYISGKWQFNETVDVESYISEEVNFWVTTKYHYDGIIYTGYGAKIRATDGLLQYFIDYSVPPDPDNVLPVWIDIFGTDNGIVTWTYLFDSNVRVVDFGTEPQYVTVDFYEWLTNNANKILEINMKDMFFNYNESQAQVGYKSAVLYKKQGDTKYRFLAASETVPFPYGTKDTFEYDLLNSRSKGMVEGKDSLEQKEVELLYTPNNAYLFETLKGQVLDFMSLTPNKIGYKYHGTISFRPNDATADIHRGTYTITPMGASEVPYFMARKECYAPLFFADVIPYEISLAELGDDDSVKLNLGLAGNYNGAVYKYDKFSEDTNRFSGNPSEITVSGGIGSIPKNAGLYIITAEPKTADKETHSGCFTLVYVID